MLNLVTGLLPQSSAYTYAVELSIDELREVGLNSIEFSKPVYLYLDNFLDLPLGSIVPSGYYDRDQSQDWIASENGRIIQRVQGGIDSDGDGQKDAAKALKKLGFSDDELQKIVDAYPVGHSLWRVPVTHFSPYDLNWPTKFPDDAQPLSEDEIPDFPPAPNEDTCKEEGSIIECESQTLGKAIHIPGSDMTLWYRSDRVQGRGRRMVVHLSASRIPASLEDIHATIRVAGRTFDKTFDAEKNLTWEFEWDGLDAYERPLGRDVPVKARVDYRYKVSYVIPAEAEQSFAQNGGAEALRAARTIGVKSRSFVGTLGALDAKSVFGLGGWMLDTSVFYQGDVQRLYLPNTASESKTSSVSKRIRTLAEFDREDGLIFQLLNAPDGDVYIVATTALFFGQHLIYKMDSAGNYVFVAGARPKEGGGLESLIDSCIGDGNCGVGGPPEDFAFIGIPAIDKQGAIYFVDRECIRKFDPEKMTYENWGGDCEGELRGRQPDFDLIAACDSGIYVTSNRKGIWKFDRQGNKTLVAGFGPSDSFDKTYLTENIDGKAALGTALGEIISPACAPDGDLFWIDEEGSIIKLDKGRLSVYWANLTKEDPLTALSPSLLVDASSGGPHVSVRQGNALKIYKSGPGQLFHTAGVGFDVLSTLSDEEQEARYLKDNIPARDAFFFALPTFIERGDNALVIADTVDTGSLIGANRFRVITSALPDMEQQVLVDPSGNALMSINESGLLVKNTNARTGDKNYEITYNADGFVTKIQRYDGLVMNIERDVNGELASFLGYFGTRTDVVLNEDGYIKELNFADASKHQFDYTKDGLLTRHEDIGGAISSYAYDKQGGVSRIDRPDGSWKTLKKIGRLVQLKTSSGREILYAKEGEYSGKNVTDAKGRSWVSFEKDGEKIVQKTDGSIIRTRRENDPRFGSAAAYTSEHRIEQPSGLTQEISIYREVELSDPNDLLSVSIARDSITKNGKKWISEFDTQVRSLTKTSPMGRKVVYYLDDKGRVKTAQKASLRKSEFTYSPGLLDSIHAGSFQVNFEYDSRGFTKAISTPETRLETQRNALGVLASLTRGGRTIDFKSNPHGIISEISTQENSPWMTFDWDPLGHMSQKTFADGSPTSFEYNETGMLTNAQAQGLDKIEYTYDETQNLSAISVGGRNYTLSYHPQSGLISKTKTPEIEKRFEYDGSLRTLYETKIGALNGSISKNYNPSFGVASRSINGKLISYEYDDDGLITRAEKTTLRWAPDIELLDQKSVGGVKVEHRYNDLGQRISSSWTGPAGFNFADNIVIDNALRVTQHRTASSTGPLTRDFSFDDFSRLVALTSSEGDNQIFTFDIIGNRTSNNGDAQTYDSSGRLESVGNRNYTYDLIGRMAARSGDTFDYDAFNQLTTAHVGGDDIGYGYDMSGNRVSKSRGGILEKIWLYDDSARPHAELDGKGDLKLLFVYSDNETVPDYIEKDGKTYAIVSDYLGSVRYVVDASSGAIAQALEYDAWGRITLDTQPGFQPFAFAGAMLDKDSQLLHMGSRDYDAFSGRYTTIDPTGLGGGDVNPWAYVGGNPVSRVDPSGHFWVLVVGAAILIPGGLFILNVEDTAVASSPDAQGISQNLGGHNGPGDALRHCTMNCRMTRNHGLATAQLASWSHEAPIPFIGGGLNNVNNPERFMDDHNNACGQRLAENQPSDKSCQRGCEELLLNGGLRTLNLSQWDGQGSDAQKTAQWQNWQRNGIRTRFLRSDIFP